VVVSDGTYSENINFLNKMITVKSVNGPASTIIQGDGSNKAVVKFVSGEGAYSVLDGFTIDNQYNSGYSTRGVVIANSSPTIRNCIIQDNKLKWCRGGGGVYISGGGATIENTIIGGSEETKNTACYGGGIYFINSTDGTLSISDSTISHNGGLGGGIYLSNINNTTSITNSNISNNICNGNYAGGIYSNNAPLLITGSHVDNNSAPWDGGGIYVIGDSTSATIIGSTVNGNKGRHGGGIHFGGTTDGSLSISDSTIDDNSCSFNGGGIYSKHQATITNTTISNNSSGWDGAGLHHVGDSPTVIIENSTFDSNTASRWGGGINFASSSDGTLLISDSAIINNTGSSAAGGLRLLGSTVTPSAVIERTVIAGNKTVGGSGHGGGVYVYSDTGTSILSTFRNCSVTGNHSPSSYGGGFSIYGSGSTAEIINCTISGNTGQYSGGVNAGSNTTVINSILWGNLSPQYPAYNEVKGSPNITYSDVQGGYAGTGNISIDPLFVNPVDAALAPTTDGDYHIQWSSPVIDQGTSSGAPADDIDGDSRPAGEGFDMGSDESSP
jgi:hypothetical protein